MANKTKKKKSIIEEVVEAVMPKAARASTEASTKEYPVDPATNPGFDDGSTLRNGIDVAAIPTKTVDDVGVPVTVDSTLTYGVDVALANTEAVTEVEKLALEATMTRIAALHDEQAYDPYERKHAV